MRLRVPPQPSLQLPHSAPNDMQVLGLQAGGGSGTSMQEPPEQAWLVEQPPQCRVPPQPSLQLPHSFPNDRQVAGSQGGGGADGTFTHTPLA